MLDSLDRARERETLAEAPRVTIHVGDARDVLGRLTPGTVDACVTSPPYFQQRDYHHEGQVGAEPTVAEYLETLSGISALVRRALAPTATYWLNLGDGYAKGNDAIPGVRRKNLLMVPARAAIRLQEDGWYLRSQVIWHKPSAMPDNARDRPGCCHESVFLLTPNAESHYDAEAVRVPATSKPQRRLTPRTYGDKGVPEHRRGTNYVRDEVRHDSPDGKRHLRNVWTIPTATYRGSHFAVFPEALVEPCILAGSRVGRTVLDPFGGSGTTALVAHRLGRDAILVERSRPYAEMAAERLAKAGVPASRIALA